MNQLTIQNELMQALNDSETEIIQIRRYLHQHPEVSFHEKNTSKYIKDFYHKLGIETKNFGDGYGFVVDIDSGRPGKLIALRADFDALAIQEENDLPFKSENSGVMHACGHDGHTAYMMILAKNLYQMKNKLHGKIRIIHQPAEEITPGGAKSMIKDGVLEGIDEVIGAHVMTSMPTGSIGYHWGETQTGRADFSIKFIGKGGHASMPHLSKDAIVAGSYFVTALQTVVSRNIDPFDTASVTIGSFDGVGSNNAIKASVELKGDVRIMKESTRSTIHQRIETIAKSAAEMFDMKVEIDYNDNYPVLVNDEELTKRVVKSIKDAKIPEIKQVFDCGPQDPSEDFAYFAQERPSCFFYVGCDPDDGMNHPHHSPEFLMDENCLLVAAKGMGSVVLNLLKS